MKILIYSKLKYLAWVTKAYSEEEKKLIKINLQVSGSSCEGQLGEGGGGN